jgi:hypothetical protein
MTSRDPVSIAHAAGARRGLAFAASALCLLVSVVPGLAQPAAPAATIPMPPPSTIQTRIDAAAQALQNNPRLKGLDQQQRVARVDFVVGNTLVLLLHEVGHVLVSEFALSVLGREEDAADTYSALTMLGIGTSFTVQSLADAAKGWFLDARRDQETGDKPLYYDEHNVSAQRAYQIVCLMVGSDPENSKASPTRRRCRRNARRPASATTGRRRRPGAPCLRRIFASQDSRRPRSTSSMATAKGPST